MSFSNKFIIDLPAMRSRDPPKVIHNHSTYYKFHSPIAANHQVYLYLSASGQPIVAKVADSREVEMHERVAGSAAQRHPNIVEYVGAATFQGNEIPKDVSPYDCADLILLMQYVNGGDLRELATYAYEHGHKIPAQFCFHVLGCVVDALIYLQTVHGVQHDDVHLGNVTFDIKDGLVRFLLIDYGKVTVLPKRRNWEKELTSSLARTATVIQFPCYRYTFEAEFIQHVATIPVESHKQKEISLHTLRELRKICLEKAGGGTARIEDLPVWLAEYFADLLKRQKVLAESSVTSTQ